MRGTLIETATKRSALFAACALCIAFLSGCETAPVDGWDSANSWQQTRPTFFTVVVHRGDTMSVIAARYNSNASDLSRANQIAPDATLYPGDVLRVPVNGSTRHAVMRDATNERANYAPPTDKDRRIAANDPAIAPRTISPNDRIVVRNEPPIASVPFHAHPPITPRVRPQYATPPVVESGEHLFASTGGAFIVPVSGRVIVGFGDTGSGQRNDGINIAAPVGTPIRAAADGVVSYAGNELKGYGNLILIKHDGDYVTAYAHTNSIGVARGQRVAKGDVIGTVGQTGDVDQPQLHFEVRQGMRPIDPRPLMMASAS